MPVWSWLLRDYTLTKKLRDYSVKNVKIAEADQARSRALVSDYIEDEIMVYCRRNSTLPILRLEYTGSIYERLKREASDEVDFMVVLKTDKPWLWGEPEVMIEDTDVPAYVRLKAREKSQLRKFSTPDGFVNAERIRDGWFHSLLAQAVNAFNNTSSSSDVSITVRYHGPAVQLDIMKRRTYKKILSVDLVPCFETDYNEYLVPKTSASLSVRHPELFWRRSFSLREKYMLQCMDGDDHGCRHELLRIVKTLFKRELTSSVVLQSYHLKTAFMHYVGKRRKNWNGRNSLGSHFVGFFENLQSHLKVGNLQHFWLPGMNLLEDTNPAVVQQMGNRFKNILNSEAEINYILSGGRMLRSQEMPHDPSWLKLWFELVLVLLENIFGCIVFGVTLVIVLVLALVLVLAIAVLLSVEPPPNARPEA